MKRNYFILIILIILFSVAYYYFADVVISNRVDEVAKLDRQIRLARQDLNSLIVQNEKLGEFTTILTNTLTKDTEFSSDEIHEIIFILDEIAQRYAINISGINHKSLFTAADQLDHEFSFVFDATYVRLGRFLNDLEKMDYLTVINAFTIDPVRSVEKKHEIKNVEDLEKDYTVNLSISFIKHKMR